MKKYYKNIFKLIIPSMITTLFTGIYVIIDGFFIGQKMGDIGLAAINIAWPIAGFIQCVGIALGMSCGIYITYFQAKEKEEKIKPVLTNFFILIGVFSSLFFVILLFKEKLLMAIGADEVTLPYAVDYISWYIYFGFFEIIGCAFAPIMRNFNYFKRIAVILIIEVLINFLFDYLLIYLGGLELKGAAIASVISMAFTGIYCISFLLVKKKIQFCKEINFKWLLSILRKGFAPFILTYSASILIIVYNLYAWSKGGNEAVAAYTVISYIIYIPQCISVGISDGIQPLLTYEHNVEDGKMKTYFYHTLVILASMMAFLTILFIFLRSLLARMFNITSTAELIYNDSYLYFMFSFVFIGIVRLFAARFYSTNNNYKADIIVLFEPIFTPLILLLLVNNMGIIGIWLGFLIMQILLSILSVLMTVIPIPEVKQFEYNK